MKKLKKALDKAKIKYIEKEHAIWTELKRIPTAKLDKILKKLVDPIHLRVGPISIIKGEASFGLYELYGGKFTDPERFTTPKQVINAIS